MLGVNQLDFINYCNALKGNYRKGVHKMETLLENPTHAKEFANNLGGVSVVLGTPVGKEDRNSETLRSMLLASDVANDAVYTWMGQFYEFSSWDDLLSDASRCNEIMNDPLKSRAVSGSGVAVGKMVATIAGLSCSAYADMSAVAASSTAMAAVINNSTALNAVVSSSTAMTAIASSQTAMAAVANNKTALTAVINNASALNTVVSSSTAMTAIASSQTAMAAIFRSSTALQVVQNNASAWAIFSNASSAVMGKTVAELAGLNPSGYADMNAIASSSTAMTAIASSQTAMTAIASSQTAMAAIATSSTAMSAISASTTAINALKASPLLVAKTKSGNNWTTETVRSGRGIAVYIYGASVSGGNGWVKTDNVQTTFSSNGTNQNLLKAFQTSLSVYWYQNSSTLYYIPC